MPDDQPTPSPRTVRLRVAATEIEADDTRSFVLVPESGADLPEWTPGAHIDVHLPGGMIRQYSLCGDPADRRRWRIGVLREPTGRGGSTYLHEQVRAGTVLEASTPRNNFPLRPAEHYVFVAGGIGITPLLPMIRRAEAAGPPWTLHYGGRNLARMAFRGELESYGDEVILYPEDQTGLLPLEDIVRSAGEDGLVYCCGPEPLLAAVENAWRGRPSERLRIERFHPREVVADPAADGAFDVRIHSTGRSVRVAGGQSILDVLAKAGLEVPSSCREGTCATCETGVIEGSVDHRDSILSEEEKETGKTMMICVSRARSAELTLDL
ncbi:PDR/VanB family oxidoreductase [Saccharopolyspora mangrovi]|uniref:PDR/VanB family oxidoreductase n=1 Tax=Saccharopolyspora mangrovi TaxID=3082379 RepID=A0ABU6AHE3_9PSEU|nr:PDR/VanB family oxidoreductase [Saccharopolyspora sp. S2-29]MEB3370989.1 PDR/VanB family oxidoreductase [Saccharopolyspora sp. S2-29]